MSGPDPAPHPSPRIRRHPGRGPPPCAAAPAPRPRARAQALLARPIPGPRVPGRARVGVGSRARPTREGRALGRRRDSHLRWAGDVARRRLRGADPPPPPPAGPGRPPGSDTLFFGTGRVAQGKEAAAGREEPPAPPGGRPSSAPSGKAAVAASPAGRAGLVPFLARVPGRSQASSAPCECPAAGSEPGVPGWGVGTPRPKQPASFVIREPGASETWNFRSGWSWAPWSQVDTPHLPTPGLRMPRTCRPHCGLILNRGGE